jgi:hypothetical protein
VVKRLAAFELLQGGSVVVEVADSDPGYDRLARGAGELVADTGRQFRSALDVIGPIADALIDKMGGLAARPDTVEVQFGVRLNAQVGAVIASTQAEGHLQVSLTWTSPRTSGSKSN